MMRPLPAFRKTLAGLVPANDAGREQLAKVKPGAVCIVTVRRPRNLAHHKKMFALLSLIVDNGETFATVDEALYAIKAALGLGKWAEIAGASRPLFIADSIAFESMAQDDFEVFYDKAVATVRKHWLAVDDAELRAAVEQFQGA